MHSAWLSVINYFRTAMLKNILWYKAAAHLRCSGKNNWMAIACNVAIHILEYKRNLNEGIVQYL